MHLVFVSSLPPAGPPESVSGIANHAVVDGLRQAGARVTLLGFRQPGAAPGEQPDTFSLGDVDPAAGRGGVADRLRLLATAYAAGIPASSAALRYVRETEMRAALSRLEPFDGVVLGGVLEAGAFERVFSGRPYIFLAHDVEHVRAMEAAREAIGFSQRLLLRREARVLSMLEGRLCDRARFALTLSQEDRESLGVAEERSRVLPLVMPQPSALAGERIPAFDVGMAGDWTQPSNRAGLEWFLQHVVPLLHPDISIAVAGPAPRRLANREKHIAFLGRVIDEREFLRQCRVVALTARAKTGVHLPAIETLELGLPAVATPPAMRGIVAVPANVRVAADPKDFAAALQESVVGQRTGFLPDADGAAFRAAQLERQRKVLDEAVRNFVVSGPRRGSAG
ncbi:MAG: glycosyltransferase family 4 protein [Oricola sp.]